MADRNIRTDYWQFLSRRLYGSFSEQFNAAFNKLQFTISYCFFHLELPEVHFPDATFAFTMTVILGFLQLKYQGKNSKNPFDSHPMTTTLAITSLLLCGLAYSIELRFSSNHRYTMGARNVVRCSMLFTGYLCLAATASFLFPDSVRPLIYAFYFITSAAELLYWVYQRFAGEIRTFHERRRRIQRILTSIRSFISQCFTNRSPILPL